MHPTTNEELIPFEVIDCPGIYFNIFNSFSVEIFEDARCMLLDDYFFLKAIATAGIHYRLHVLMTLH